MGPKQELIAEEANAFIEEALSQYQLRPRRVQPVATSFNTLFRIAGDTDTYVLRIGPALRIHDLDAAEAEASWTEELAATGLPVPRLVRTFDGRAAVTVVNGATSRVCTLCTWIDGEVLPRPMSPTDATELGELAARLHATSPPRAENPTGALDGRRVLLFQLPNLLHRAPEAEVFLAALHRAQTAMDRLWTRPEVPRLVHGDLTASNVVRTRDGLVPIDFQDMFWGHPQQDIANSLFSYLRHDDGTLATAFRSGYERLMTWPEFDVIALEDLFAARRLMMANLALALDRPGVDDYLAGHAPALRTYAAQDA